MTDLIKPIKGVFYKLTYYKTHSRGRDIVTENFEWLAMRGSKYYFHSSHRGIDLTLTKWEFNEYLENTKKLTPND